MGNNKIVLGITIGDPAGIGPEVALKALEESSNSDYIPIIIARNTVLTTYHPDISGKLQVANSTNDLLRIIQSSSPSVYNVENELPMPKPGKGNADTGLESRLYIDTAIELWKKGIIDAVVTGPVSKGLIEKSGCPFTGHTEYIASRTGEDKPYMMMYSDKFRVLLATTHIPLSMVSSTINEELLYNTIKTGASAIIKIDGKPGTLAITGLDPHCGDDGAISNFDRDTTKAALDRARKEGISIEGPFSADTIFLPGKWDKYSLVIAHYHDQGLIPFKVLAFDNGVNVTLGLPIVRTSVDHGTAFDIAGKNIAKYESMVEAINLACKLVKS